MIPLEVVVRGVAAGSFVKRNPAIARARFSRRGSSSSSLKTTRTTIRRSRPTGSSAEHRHAARSRDDVGAGAAGVRDLSHAWRKRDTLLVDLKVEFGRLTSGPDKGQLVLADVIDNDSWRIWPQGREEMMLDKQCTGICPRWTTRRSRASKRLRTGRGSRGHVSGDASGMAAVIADGPENVDAANAVVGALAQLGLPTVRHVAVRQRRPATCCNSCSSSKRRSAACSSSRCPKTTRCARCWRRCLVAVLTAAASPRGRARVREDARAGRHRTVRRTLLTQANARANVMNADARLQQSHRCRRGLPLPDSPSRRSTIARWRKRPRRPALRCEPTSCGAFANGSDGIRPSSNCTRSTRSGASIAATSRAGIT